MAVAQSDFGVPNPPVRFEQDPESPDGTGMFHFQDGSSLFAHEPELAKRVAPPDERTAQNDAKPGNAGYWLDAPVAAPQAAPSRLDAGGGLTASAGTGNAHAAPTGPLPGSYGPGGRLNVAGVVPDRPLDELIASGKPAPQAAPDPAAAAALYRRLAAGPAGAEPPPAAAPLKRPWVAGRQGGAVPVSSSTTIESQGAPYSLEDATLRARANEQVVEAQMSEYAAQKATADAHAAAMQAAIPELQYQEARGKSELNRMDQGYREERARVRTIIEEHDKQAKPDTGRFYKRAGTAGTIAMVIGQALGAYAATISHTENFAQKIVSQAWEHDMRAQEEEIAAGKVGDNNLLARLNDQLGDLDQAKSAVKLIQADLLDREIKSFADHAQSAAASRAAGMWMAQNQQQRLLEEQRFRDLSIGKQTMKTDAKIVAPSSGHYMSDEELMRQQLKTNKLRGDLLQSENEVGYQRQGGDQAGKIAKRTADEGPHVGQRAQGQIVAARNAREVVHEVANALGMRKDARGNYEDPSLLNTVWSKMPLTDAKQKIDAAKLSLIAEIGKAQNGGALTVEEAHAMQGQVDGLKTPGQIGAFVRHYDHMMKGVEQNVRDTAATSGRGGPDDHDGGGR